MDAQMQESSSWGRRLAASLPVPSVCSVAQSRLTLWTAWTAARQASPPFTVSQSLLKLTSVESVMPSAYCLYNMGSCKTNTQSCFHVLPFLWKWKSPSDLFQLLKKGTIRGLNQICEKQRLAVSCCGLPYPSIRQNHFSRIAHTSL